MESVEPLQINMENGIPIDTSSLACPNCKVNSLVDVKHHWLVDEGKPVSIDDYIVKCVNCWMNFTVKYVRENE